MSWSSKDGAVVTVDPDPPSGGLAVNCTTCRYVTSGALSDKAFINVEAECHASWHDGEYDRVQQYR